MPFRLWNFCKNRKKKFLNLNKTFLKKSFPFFDYFIIFINIIFKWFSANNHLKKEIVCLVVWVGFWWSLFNNISHSFLHLISTRISNSVKWSCSKSKISPSGVGSAVKQSQKFERKSIFVSTIAQYDSRLWLRCSICLWSSFLSG